VDGRVVVKPGTSNYSDFALFAPFLRLRSSIDAKFAKGREGRKEIMHRETMHNDRINAVFCPQRKIRQNDRAEIT